MTQHTPGPWTLDERYAPMTGIVGADGFSVADVEDICISPTWQEANQGRHWGSADESHIERPEAEVEANARLIAAAPELLDTLRRLVDVLNDDLDPEQCAVWDAAVAAIAKAEGRS